MRVKFKKESFSDLESACKATIDDILKQQEEDNKAIEDGFKSYNSDLSKKNIISRYLGKISIYDYATSVSDYEFAWMGYPSKRGECTIMAMEDILSACVSDGVSSIILNDNEMSHLVKYLKTSTK